MSRKARQSGRIWRVYGANDCSVGTYRDHKGWKALGYASFEEYGFREHGWKRAKLDQESRSYAIELSLNIDDTIGGQITERQLRPLSPLTDEERRQVWSEATAKAQEEGQKLTAKLVQEAVDRLKKEQGLLEKDKEDWREQAIKDKKSKIEAEQKLEVAKIEAAKLRNTIAEEAKTLANAEIMRIKVEIVNLEEEKLQVENKLKLERKGKQADVDRLVAQSLQKQQSLLDAKESQIVTIERRIEILQRELQPLENKFSAANHHAEKIKESGRLLNSLSLAFTDAFDPDFAAYLPSTMVESWQRIANRMRQGADDLSNYLSNVATIVQTEVVINEQEIS